MNTTHDFFKNMNVPNMLTLARLFLVPVYLVLFSLGFKFEALATFIIASLTDLLDGMIARKYNLITDFGKLMDPLADKIMVLSAMLSMTIGNGNTIPAVIPWAVVLIVLFKEAVLVCGGIALYRRGYVSYSRMIGKVAHVFLIAGLILSYFHSWFVIHCANWFLPLDLFILWLAVILTLGALLFYVRDSLRQARQMGILSKSPNNKHRGDQKTNE